MNAYTDSDDLLARFAYFATARQFRDREAIAWIGSSGRTEETFTFSEFAAQACAVAGLLKGKADAGAKIMLVFLPGTQFMTSFFGVLLAGMIPSPVHPPDPRKPEKGMDKLRAAVEVLDPAFILSHDSFLLAKLVQQLSGGPSFPDVEFLSVSSVLRGPMRVPDVRLMEEAASMDEDRVVLLQFSSGSTGKPKAVAVRMKNLNANLKAIQNHQKTSPRTRGFAWVPLTHDMGLIGALCHEFFVGAHYCAMSPLSFLQKPALWLQMVSKLGCTVTTGVNFAYDLCVNKINLHELEGVDLSKVERWTNGGEPVRVGTLRRFAKKFARFGVRFATLDPCYGLAENVLFVSQRFGTEPCMPLIIRANVESLVVGSKPRLSVVNSTEEASKDDGVQELVGNGTPALGSEVVVVDPQTMQKLGSGYVGEIWISGASKALGYMTEVDIIDETGFSARLAGVRKGSNPREGFFRTGDIGFVYHDQIFVCGRLKDMIIVNGQNYFPQDIAEQIEIASELVRPGCTSVFGKRSHAGTEAVITLVEVRNPKAAEDVLLEHARKIKHHVAATNGVEIHQVVFLPSRTIPKTTSGKVQNRKAKMLYTSGKLLALFVHGDGERSKVHDADGPVPDVFLDADDVAMDWLQKEVATILGMEKTSFSVDDNLLNLGLTSFATPQIMNALSKLRGGDQSLDATEMPLTVRELISFARETPKSETEEGISSSLPALREAESVGIPAVLYFVLQLLGMCCISLLAVSSVLPSYYFAEFIISETRFGEPWRTIKLWDEVHQFGLLIPWVIPLWMFSFTMCVVALKWIVIGRYSPSVIRIGTVSFLRWWLVDRAVHVWEIFVGSFLTDTPLLNLVLLLFGARVSISAELHGTLFREHDLITISRDCIVSGRLIPRIFDAESQTLRMRRITLREGSRVDQDAMILGGASLARGVRIHALCVIPEGAITEAHAVYEKGMRVGLGLTDDFIQGARSFLWIPELLVKVTLMILTMYLFAASSTFIVAFYGFVGYSNTFRYMPLVYWMSMFLGTGCCFAILAIFLKLLLFRLGNGPYACFLVDFQWKIALFTCWRFWDGTWLQNVVIWAYGNKISKDSFCFLNLFRPSVTFDIGKNTFIGRSSLHIPNLWKRRHITVSPGVNIYHHSVLDCGSEVRSNVEPLGRRKLFDCEEPGRAFFRDKSDDEVFDACFSQFVHSPVDRDLLHGQISRLPRLEPLAKLKSAFDGLETLDVVLESIRLGVRELPILFDFLVRIGRQYGEPSIEARNAIVEALHWVVVLDEATLLLTKARDKRWKGKVIHALKSSAVSLPSGFARSSMLSGVLAIVQDETDEEAMREVLALGVELASVCGIEGEVAKGSRGGFVEAFGFRLIREIFDGPSLKRETIHRYLEWSFGSVLGIFPRRSIPPFLAILFLPRTILHEATSFLESRIISISLALLCSELKHSNDGIRELPFVFESALIMREPTLCRFPSRTFGSPYAFYDQLLVSMEVENVKELALDQLTFNMSIEETAGNDERKFAALEELSAIFLRIVMISGFCLALIPPYEWAVFVLFGEPFFWTTVDQEPIVQARPVQIVLLFPCVMLALVSIAAWVWLNVRPFIIRGISARNGMIQIHRNIYLNTLAMSILNESFLWPLVHGTLFYNWWARSLGCRLGANVLVLSSFVREHGLLEIQDNAIVDSAFVAGHQFFEGVLQGGETRVGASSTVHPSSIMFAGTETAPFEQLRHETLGFRKLASEKNDGETCISNLDP